MEKSNRHGHSDREINADTHNVCVTVSWTCVHTVCVCVCVICDRQISVSFADLLEDKTI